jgi:hypothetical protein
VRQVISVGRRVKNAVVRDEMRYRRLRLGLARGCFLPINLRHQSRWLLGLYEPEIAKYVRRWARPGDVCYDIGAAQGYYTAGLARLVEPGTVYGIEGDAALCAELDETIRHNPQIRSRMVAHCAFVGERGESSLDHLVYSSGWPAPGLLKVDVEGAEVAVLRGSARILRDKRPAIILEVHGLDLEAECLTILEALAYEITVVKQSRLLPDHRPIAHNRWIVAH